MAHSRGNRDGVARSNRPSLPVQTHPAVPFENVRAVLAAVDSGDVDAAIVFSTDVRASRQARIAFEVPKSDAPDIRYSVAKLTQAGNMQGAARLMERLCAPEAAAVFRKHGFTVLQ